jgi:hypothetical protein
MNSVAAAEAAAIRSAKRDATLSPEERRSSWWLGIPSWSATGDGKKTSPGKVTSTEVEKDLKDGKRQ